MIHKYDLNNVPLSACIASGLTTIDSFSNDCMFVRFHPDLFGEKPTMEEPQRTATKDKLGKVLGEGTFLDVLSGKTVFFNLEEDSEVVATAIYNLPEHQRPKLTIAQRLRYWGNWAYFKLKNLLKYPLLKKYLADPVQNEFINNMNSYGLTPQQHKEYREKLSSLSPQELSSKRYPRKDTLYLHVFGVKQSAAGKGYGAKLLTKSLAEFNVTGPEFKHGYSVTQGPPKASLVPTRGNDRFYSKYGFRVVEERSSDDSTCVYQVMEKVLA